MSVEIGAADSSYDYIGYKPKPSCNFSEEAVEALSKCLGADEPPSNTDTPTEQVDDEPPATSVETEDDAAPTVPHKERVVKPSPTPPPKPGGN